MCSNIYFSGVKKKFVKKFMYIIKKKKKKNLLCQRVHLNPLSACNATPGLRNVV